MTNRLKKVRDRSDDRFEVMEVVLDDFERKIEILTIEGRKASDDLADISRDQHDIAGSYREIRETYIRIDHHMDEFFPQLTCQQHVGEMWINFKEFVVETGTTIKDRITGIFTSLAEWLRAIFNF